MVQKLSLRLRVFLFFALIGLFSLLAIAGGMFFAHSRLEEAGAVSALITGGIVSGLAILALVTWVWLQFDEHVSRPLMSLSNELRARAHAGVSRDLDLSVARYLGDLAPAAAAVTTDLSRARNSLDIELQQRTSVLINERDQLAAVLQDLPTPLLLCSPDHRVALYNSRAADLFPGVGLDRPVSDLLESQALRGAYGNLIEKGEDPAPIDCACSISGRPSTAQIRLIFANGSKPSYLLSFDGHEDALATPHEPVPGKLRRASYDFAVLERCSVTAIEDRPLDALPLTVFDTETTGLDPYRGDEIVQIAALRIVNGKMLDGETFDTLVNPGRRIPAASTKVHGITDAMVKDAPKIGEAGAGLHRFVGESVLIAHNAPFDLAFLRRHQANIGARFDQPVLDTVLLSAIVFGQGAAHSLDALAERLDVTIPEEVRHTAMGDTVATAQVVVKMLPMLQEKGIITLRDALERSREHRRMMDRPSKGAVAAPRAAAI